MGELNLCYGCMESKGSERICPHCGYDEQTVCLASNLKPGTMLRDRYLVGRERSRNGEGITYIAFDCNIGCKVLLREYMPEQLCTRVADSPLINVNYNHLAQYKALMAEYTELNKSLARMRSLNHLNPALDLFAENNTTYAVYEYLEGRILLDYLKENAGELTWQTVSRMFPPLFTTLSLLHNAGVLHRGISPETIFVTDKGDLKLSGFCISAVRTNDTELDAELFDGYAAPEQYFANRQQGTWTDVYGICAVLYRILTGCRATDANTRQDYDNLIPPQELSPRVPTHVSDGIMRGLCLDGSARVRTITDLVTILFEGGDTDSTVQPTHTPTSATAVTTTFRTPVVTHTTTHPVPHHTQPTARLELEKEVPEAEEVAWQHGAESEEGQAEAVSPIDRIRVPLLIAILLLAILAIVILVFLRVFYHDGKQPMPQNSTNWSSVSDNVISVSSPETTLTPKYDSIMPLLVGKNYQIKKEEMAGWLEMDPEFIYSDEYKKDQIIWQEFPENSEFLSGSSIKVQVSLGSSKKELPDFKGYKLTAYLAKLEEMGFVSAVDGNAKTTTTVATTTAAPTTSTTVPVSNAKQSIVYKTKVDYNFANGYVCDVEPAPATMIDVQKDYTIVIYYANNPEITTTGSTETTTGDDDGVTKSTTTTTKTTAKQADGTKKVQ